jgi:hypothetical protein
LSIACSNGHKGQSGGGNSDTARQDSQNLTAMQVCHRLPPNQDELVTQWCNTLIVAAVVAKSSAQSHASRRLLLSAAAIRIKIDLLCVSMRGFAGAILASPTFAAEKSGRFNSEAMND